MTKPGWKLVIVMTKSNWELVIGIVSVVVISLIYVIWNLKLDLKWYALGFIGFLIVWRSIKRILKRRRREDSNRSTLP